MSPLQVLTNPDKARIKTYINAFSGTDTPITDYYELDNILRLWDKNKKDLFKMFGEHLILSKPIKFDRSEDDRLEDYQREITDEQRSFLRKLKNKITEYNSDNNNQNYFTIYSFFNDSNLSSPRYIYEDRGVIDLPDGSSITINKGDKNMRILHKLLKAFHVFNDPRVDEEMYEQFRISVSKIIDDKIASGTYCLSIHPLDYMTMSDNTHNWSSCMNWTQEAGGGCYRRGTVEMMNSPYVVVAYVLDDKCELLYFNGDDWNSKRWRNLFIVDPKDEVITEVRPYPYDDEKLTKIGLEWLQELCGLSKAEPVKLEHKESAYAGTCTINDNTDTTIRFKTKAMYNDFRYKHKAMMTPKAINSQLVIQYSAPATCMCCGRTEDISWGEENLLLCSECQPGLRCEECGRHVSEDYAYYDEDGYCYCEECFEEYFTVDEITDVSVRKEDSFKVNVMYLDEDGNEITLDPYYAVTSSDHSYLSLFDFSEINQKYPRWGEDNDARSKAFGAKQREYEEKYPIEYGGEIVLGLSDASDLVLKAILGRTSTYRPGLWAKSRGELLAMVINEKGIWDYPYESPSQSDEVINF